MRPVDLNAAIRNLVEAEVARTLAPYRSILERMSALVGPAARRRADAPVGEGEPERRRPGRRAVRRAGNAKGDATRFHEGQTVRYKQGRGEFEAKVLKVDPDSGMVTIERAADGKKVDRPAAKIYEVA